MREDRGTAPGARRGAHAGPPARPPRPGPWLRGLRPRTVRARIIALLMVPVVSVIALWGFATVTTAQGVWGLMRQRDAQRTLLTPVAETVAGLQAERTAVGQLLAAPVAAPSAVRESALREALRAQGGAVVRTGRAPLSVRGGLAAATRLLTAEGDGPAPTALVCDSDLLAAGALKAARRLGLRVPEELSVTGFDDLMLATAVEPELTTVRLPAERVGAAGMRALLAVLEGERVETARLPVHLVARGSTGPCPTTR